MRSYKRKIRLQDTDAAGSLFFSNYFVFFHEAFESFLESSGFDLAAIINSNEYLIPIAHLEADYKNPLFLGETIEIQVTIERIGESSFVLLSHFIKDDKACAGIIKTVHVSVDAKTRKKIPLPEALRNKISELYNHQT